MWVIIAMDGDGNYHWGDGQQFTRQTADVEVAALNRQAAREGSDWHHMLMPAEHWEDCP